MSVSMDLPNQCFYQSPDGWTMAWNQNAIGVHQNKTNATASYISSDTSSSNTASDASNRYNSTSSDASSSTSTASPNQDGWFTPAQFVQSKTFPYFNGSASFKPNRDMAMQWSDDKYDGCLFNSTVSLEELVTNTNNNMFVTATQPPLPEVVKVTSTIRNVKLKKRFRTAYTTDQINAMEEEFRKQSYLSKPEREKLCKRIGVSDRALKVWFQNRRMKEKKNEGTDQTPKLLQVATNNPNEVQLAINDNVVNRDFEHIPSNLVEEIEQLMCDNTNGVDFNIETSETKVVNTVEYEPITPLDGHSIELGNWKTNENEKIMTLLDFKFCS